MYREKLAKNCIDRLEHERSDNHEKVEPDEKQIAIKIYIITIKIWNETH